MALRNALQTLRTQRNGEQVKEPPSSLTLPQDDMGLCSFEDIDFSDDENDMIPKLNEPSEATPICATPINDPIFVTPCSTTSFSSNSIGTGSCNSIPASLHVATPNNTATPIGLSVSHHLLSTPKASKQKFPGPAGLLPKLQSGQSIDSVHIPIPSQTPPPSPLTTPRKSRLTAASPCTSGTRNTGTNTTGTAHISTFHQSSITHTSSDFTSPPWTTMIRELSDPSLSHLTKYTIAYVKRMAINQQLIAGKIPHLRVLVKSVTNNIKNISALVKDETGEMLATVHMGVWDVHKEEWGVGCCMVLRQVSIISPTPRKHYLNITLDNIVRLYSINESTNPQTVVPAHVLKSTEEGCGHGNVLGGPNLSRMKDVTNNVVRLPSKTKKPSRPSELMDTRPSEPMDTRPSQPIDTRPSQPMDTRPSQPMGTRPSQPMDTGLSQPMNIRPSQPMNTGPSKLRPSQPIDTRPSTLSSLITSPKPSTLCSEPSTSTLSTDIEDDFDAFFDSIDISQLDAT